MPFDRSSAGVPHSAPLITMSHVETDIGSLYKYFPPRKSSQNRLTHMGILNNVVFADEGVKGRTSSSTRFSHSFLMILEMG